MTYRIKERGYSLLEMLAVLAIISITTCLAESCYQNYMIKQHRKDAISELYALSLALEEYAFETDSYAGATILKLHLSTHVSKNTYEIIINRAEKNYFSISAKPLATQQIRDTQCDVLSLDSKGVKSVSGRASVATCW